MEKWKRTESEYSSIYNDISNACYLAVFSGDNRRHIYDVRNLNNLFLQMLHWGLFVREWCWIMVAGQVDLAAGSVMAFRCGDAVLLKAII